MLVPTSLNCHNFFIFQDINLKFCMVAQEGLLQRRPMAKTSNKVREVSLSIIGSCTLSKEHGQGG